MTIDDAVENAAPRRKPITPATDKSLIQKWTNLVNEYVDIKGMPKWEAYSKVARDHGANSAYTVWYWTQKNVRQQECERKKNYQRDRTTENERSKTRTRMYIYRNPEKFISPILDNADRPLTDEEITFQIQHVLRENSKPPILIKNSTLRRILIDYFKEHGKELAHLVQDGDITGYVAPSKLGDYGLLKK